MNRKFYWAGAAVAVLALASSGIITIDAAKPLAPQTPAAQADDKKTEPTDSDEAVLRGKALFKKQCSACHYPDSDSKKIGPGLKGLNKRGTFANGTKVTEESIKTLIQNGNSVMPPFKDALNEDQLRDLIRYVRTL